MTNDNVDIISINHTLKIDNNSPLNILYEFTNSKINLSSECSIEYNFNCFDFDEISNFFSNINFDSHSNNN